MRGDDSSPFMRSWMASSSGDLTIMSTPSSFGFSFGLGTSGSRFSYSCVGVTYTERRVGETGKTNGAREPSVHAGHERVLTAWEHRPAR